MTLTARIRRALPLFLVAVLLAPLVWSAHPANAAPPPVKLVKVASFKYAIDTAVNPATGGLYVATRNGRVYMLRPGKSAKQVLDIRWRVRMAGERGLLGITFHPTLPYVYIVYNSVSKSAIRLVEYQVRPDGTFRTASHRVVLIQTKPDTNHNGGDVDFGPDGYLYQSFGDGGGAGDPKRNALNLGTMLGKIIRIDPRPANGKPYTVPADNPFVGVPGARPEIWSIGWRNPWRWSFDSQTGDMWVGDVGQRLREEVNLARAADGGGKGLSYGWSAREGSLAYNVDQPQTGHEDPIYELTHDQGACSVIGGVVYRGAALPDLQGAYVFADFCMDELFALTLDGNDSPTVTEIGAVSGAVSFGEDASGELLVVTIGGTVWRITANI